MSMATNECQKLDAIMSWNLPMNCWRACINADGVIFSCQCKVVETASGGSAIGKKFVISNAFTATPLQLTIPLSSSTGNSEVT